MLRERVAPLLQLLTSIYAAFRFVFYCFLKPIGHLEQQADRLNAFYEKQASTYDISRNRLLRGRDTMLKLLAAALEEQGPTRKKLIWLDIGGATGRNIEEMNAYFPIKNFDAVYCVDLCEPLLEGLLLLLRPCLDRKTCCE